MKSPMIYNCGQRTEDTKCKCHQVFSDLYEDGGTATRIFSHWAPPLRKPWMMTLGNVHKTLPTMWICYSFIEILGWREDTSGSRIYIPIYEQKASLTLSHPLKGDSLDVMVLFFRQRPTGLMVNPASSHIRSKPTGEKCG